MRLSGWNQMSISAELLITFAGIGGYQAVYCHGCESAEELNRQRVASATVSKPRGYQETAIFAADNSATNDKATSCAE
jgi:hypothetical protein